MSTNVALAGLSIKIKEEYQIEKKIIEIFKKFGYLVNSSDEFYNIKWNDEKLNEWKLYCDVDGKFGLIYQNHYEYDAFNINYKLTQEKSLYIYNLLHKYEPSIIEYLDESSFSYFAIIYYNGIESPFKF